LTSLLGENALKGNAMAGEAARRGWFFRGGGDLKNMCFCETNPIYFTRKTAGNHQR
jgi:hypothetical protein